MKIAILDLGTNTFDLLIATVHKQDTQVLAKDKRAVKLRKENTGNHLLHPDAIERGLKAIEAYNKIIREQAIEHTYAFATSAIRSATNGAAFVQAVKERFGIVINVIDGGQEAELIYYGVQSGSILDSDTALLMDIGGGSTEFILADKEQYYWKKSFPLGVSRLIDSLQPKDPISPKQVQQLEHYLADTLKDLFEACKKYPPKQLVGCAGAFESFAAMIDPQPETIKEQYHFKLSDYLELHRRIVASTLEERKQMKGLISMRTDTIHLASILVHHILSKFALNEMKLSTFALSEGVLQTIKNKTSTWQRS